MTEELSTEVSRNTTEEAEFAKTGPYAMNEFPSLETKLFRTRKGKEERFGGCSTTSSSTKKTGNS